MRFEKCYKCGKDKLVSFNRNNEFDRNIGITIEDLEGYQMTYGKNKGLFRCKDCKEDSVMIKKLLSFNIIDISSFGSWTSVEELKKHYIKKEND